MNAATGVVHGCVLEGDEIEVTMYPTGPTLVRGATALRGPDGVWQPIHRRVTAICRCGRSRLTPRCDGTHRFVPAFDPGPAADDLPNPAERI